MNLLQILREFPAIFAVLGILTGGGVMFYVTKKFGPMRNDAINEVVKAYKERIAAELELAKTQAAQYMATLNMQKEHWQEELKKLESSRDQYKDDLHTARNDMGAEITQLKLDNQKLKLLPNVEILQSEQQSFYVNLSKTLKDISDELTKHDKRIDERLDFHLNPMREAMLELATSLKKDNRKARVSRPVL